MQHMHWTSESVSRQLGHRGRSAWRAGPGFMTSVLIGSICTVAFIELESIVFGLANHTVHGSFFLPAQRPTLLLVLQRAAASGDSHAPAS